VFVEPIEDLLEQLGLVVEEFSLVAEDARLHEDAGELECVLGICSDHKSHEHGRWLSTVLRPTSACRDRRGARGQARTT
jgi:hypothetical protein